MRKDESEMLVQKNEISKEARRIFELIEKSNMSEYEFSRCTGVSHVTISDWRNNSKIPSSVSIEKICRCFGITKAEFYSTGIYAKTNEDPLDVLRFEMKLHCNRIIANGDGEIGLLLLQKLSVKS